MAAYRIIVDLSEFRLYLYNGGRLIRTYPVGVGTIATSSPMGSFRIINKAPHPGGPYGAYWLGLSKPHYGIHGTDSPSSIGKRVSHGCIRMHNRDVTELASLVPVGTVVVLRK